ncbi:MAG: hypothetical protein EAS51_06845 [Microbacteriaceae bacterium]|nr:MAG: hypothetical protein EAS51_06845 [Microbacteriaceae bacterium]
MSDDTPTQRYPDGFPPPGGPHAGGAPQGAHPDGSPQPAAPEPSLADAPTERFAAPGADPAPGQSGATIPLADAAPAGAVPPASVPPAATTASGDGDRRGKGLIIGLAVAAGVLLLALIGVLLWIALGSGAPAADPTETPSGSPTPTASETPSAEPTPSETPSEEPSAAPPPPPAPPAGAIQTYTASTTTVDCSGGGPVPLSFSWVTTGSVVWFGIGTDNAKLQPYNSYDPIYTIDFERDGIAYQCGQPGGQQRYTITAELPDGSLEHKTIVIRES